MDVLYDNLENFTEEATNAELREENQNLKIKLEEYSTALEQLQKNILQEFDTLLSEHKKLELNYSSLLKTARSEIERKTQIITKLNIEKDAMVLNSIQNRNTLCSRRNPSINEPKNKEEPKFGNASPAYKSDNSTKPSYLNQVPNKRNMHTRHLDTVNKSAANANINTARNNTVKENVKLKDEHRSRARITGRRKSMPVFGMDCSKFSSDEDGVASSGSSKEFVPKEQPDNRYPDRSPRDKPIMEHKVFGQYDYKKETRSHFSKYDSSKHRKQENRDQFRNYKRNQSSDRKRRSPDRKKTSLERRRGSPDGNKKDVRDYSDEFHKRQEHDRHRRIASPHKDRYHDYKHRSRDSQRSNERHLMQDFEKYKSRSQDKFTTKHKIMHDFEEPCNKRMRVDSFPKHDEDRWRVERKVGPAALELDPLNMSCQSPDQSHFEAHPSQQTREIKLTSSMQLDDPRLSSKKYTLKNVDGKAELSTVDSTNIDVKVIDTSGWEIMKTVKMPDALLTKPKSPNLPSASGMQGISLQKPMLPVTSETSLLKPEASEIPQPFIQNPTASGISDAVSSYTPETLQKYPQLPDNPKMIISETSDMPDILSQKTVSGDESTIPDASTQKPMSNDDLVKQIYMDIENPISNMSMETVSDVYNFDEDFHNSGENTSESSTSKLTQKNKTEPLKNEKLSNSKITKKSRGDKQTDIISKGITSSDDNNSEKPNPKLKNKNIGSKTTNRTNKKPSEDLRLHERKLPPKHHSSDFQNYISAKEIIAGDLELSDETSDNADTPIIKQNPISKSKQDTEMKDVALDSDQIDKPKAFQLKLDYDDTSIRKVYDNLGENTDEIMLDIRKSKAKKKSFKLKESKELRGNKETPIPMGKPIKKQEAQEVCVNANTSLSIDQLVTIKENITKKLAHQPVLLDKPIKKKDNKSKTKETAIDKMKKEVQSKGLLEINDTVSSMDKPEPVKKKDNKPIVLPEKKETATVEKPLKKKELKTKEAVEPISAIPITKTAKTKSNIQETSSNIEKATINKKVDKKDDEYKSKTKFNELFGDSSSLVSPEDLGLVPSVVAPPENYIAMFEDAQDALDMNSIRATLTTAPTKNTNDTEVKTRSNFGINSENNKPVFPVDPYQLQGPAHAESVPTNSLINQAMYQNLQPELEQDSNIVKTVIISSGIQPQCTLEATETHSIVSDNKDTDLHIMQCVKPTVLQDIGLQALATSTPQKIWHQNVQVVEPSILENRCESREACITEIPLAATSVNPENVSPTNANDEPDVTIFVKRRRKVLKKK